ncbi:hypothetical protein NF699_17370 [Sphingomonadaceae bacterium OTU29LAMAA1]|uniref:hypothetical protein n=1 Tax=Sphingomonas sp. Leaf37 TaxID=2876552 RepID=UPI001E5DB270|nr:hypothetical protein [Sphingomonas sp. Leaf37]USU04780.1 hypothetical protein NF699_17370 [Sphingomonadaceae bacterium OTU29LAMAA1]
MTRLVRVEPQGTVRDRYLVHGTIAPRFVDAHAVTASDAIDFAPADEREAKAFAAMVSDGSIRVAVPGRFWFDMDAYEAAAAGRRAKRVPVMLIVTLLIAVGAVMFYRG